VFEVFSLRKVHISFVRPGMTIGYAVFNSRGEMLINRGAVLTARFIERLVRQGIPALYIVDDFLPDVEFEDVVNNQTRVKAINRVRNLFNRTVNSKIIPDETNCLYDSIDEIKNKLLNNQSLMINLVDIRSMDDYLFGHCVNVCVLSLAAAIHLGFNNASISILGMGALLHDVGKVMVSKDILNKPGKLTTDEYEVIKKHPSYGYEIIMNNLPHIRKLAAIIALQHHERLCGDGYPKGLTGDKIHRFSQIVGMADVYDAMTADRVYRRGYPSNEVYEMLSASGNYHFDYELVKAFLYNIAPYPVGSIVRLSSNEIGLVVKNQKKHPFHPQVKVMLDSAGKFLEAPFEIDLSKNDELFIAKVLDHAEIEELRVKAGK